jgi:LemA protein
VFGGVIIFVLIIGGVLLFMGVSIYNNLIRLNQEMDRSWANIDITLKQRFDEIPQLVQVIEQYTQYEKSVIDQVTKARAHYGQAQSVNEKVVAANEFSGAMRGLFAIGENYPELRSNQNFVQLQGRISDLENTIADRREHFNSAVTNYNTRIQQIPDVFFAGFLGYRSRDMFKVPQEETVRPSLKMNLPT